MISMPGRLSRAATLAALLSALASLDSLAAGTAVECRRDGAVRRIEVKLDPGRERICEVRYAKSEEGWTNQVLWYAEHSRRFCHDRADRLIATLARTGWVCDVMRKRNAAVHGGPEAGNEAAGARSPDLDVPRPRR